MYRRKIAHARCAALVGTNGWKRCKETAPVDTPGWAYSKFGQYCPKHAEMLRALPTGRAA